MPNKWDKIAEEAAATTKSEFKSEISSLTRLSDADVTRIISETGISKEELAGVLKEVKDPTKSNMAKAQAIGKINKGVAALVSIVKKLL